MLLKHCSQDKGERFFLKNELWTQNVCISYYSCAKRTWLQHYHCFSLPNTTSVPSQKGSFFFKFWEKEFYCFKNWILQWKVTSGMDGRGVEWRIKGVLFFKKWLALYRCIVKYRWSVMIWIVYYPICGTKDYIRYDEAVLLNQTEFLFSDCAINFDKRSFVF